MSPRVSPLAGKPAPKSLLVDVAKLLAAYVDLRPDAGVPAQRVAFGTSGHRGSAFARSFNEWHVLAISQAICDYRKHKGIDGPLYIGIDTHALSQPALESALEVLAANRVETLVAGSGEFTPTPAISHAILIHNRGRTTGLADGIVITPSHNPPEDGGFKYNPPNGGPADTDVTGWIQDRANALLSDKIKDVRRVPFAEALRATTTHEHDFLDAYVSDLGAVIDFDVIRGAGVRMGVDPLGGAGVHFWASIAERYRIDLAVVSDQVDPQFGFMTVDWDGRIRMDPSSPYAMQRLIGMQDRYDVAFACDTDHDRHGIVTRSSGLLRPNHYLAVSIDYLFRHRPQWSPRAAIGKTLVSTALIDRVAKRLDRTLYESPVGFKWFVDGLARRLSGLWWRGKRGRIVPASRRVGVDDRQGRHRAGVAVCGNHRAHRPRSRRAVPRSGRARWASRSPIAWMLQRLRRKRRSWQDSRRSRCTARCWPARKSKACSIARRAIMRRSAESR